MMILVMCPHCRGPLQAPEKFANCQVKCPKCKTNFTIPGLAASRLGSSALAATSVLGGTRAELPSLALAQRRWRYFSSPWVVLIFVFGFLPWTEVSCNNREVEFRLTQSGYQALYGGVSAPVAVEAMMVEQSERMRPPQPSGESLQGLRKQLRLERPYLASVSPFLIIFWGANFALLGIVCFAPLGGRRLALALVLCGSMLGMLIVHACLGMPLERRIGQIIVEALREDPSDRMLLLAFKNSKTVWFWLTLSSVGLLAMTEALLNGFRAQRWNGWLVPGGIAGASALLVLGCLLIQFALHETILGEMENRIAQLRKAEEEKLRQAEAERRRREAEILAAEERARRQREAEAERLRQLAALREQEARRLEQRRQREREEEERRARLEQQRQEEEARRRAEQEAKEEAARQAERERLAKEEAAREAKRKAELEKKGLPYYPRPLTRHEGHTAEEWYQQLLDKPNNARVHSQATEALATLKEEGTPYLLDHLSRQNREKDRHAALKLIKPEYIHANDLHKLLPCLDRSKAFNGTRILALSYLQKRAKDVKKKLVPEIEKLMDDMLTNSRFKEETKREIRDKLQTIRSEAK